MGANEIHLADIGTEFRVTIRDSGTALDISAANTTTARVLLFTTPTGSTSSQAAAFINSGTSGGLVFTTASGFLEVVGDWRIQAKITLGNAIRYSEIADFRVFKNLE